MDGNPPRLEGAAFACPDVWGLIQAEYADGR